MKRTRLALLATLLVLSVLAGRPRAQAAPITCFRNCTTFDEACMANCNGNPSCQAICTYEYVDCEQNCVGP